MKKALHVPGSFLKMIPGVIVFLWFCACVPSGDSGTHFVGGPCRYKSYPGQATILSISRMENGYQQDGKRFEVQFTFKPRKKVDEVFAQDETKKYHLYGDNFQYPDQEFLTRHHLQVGNVLEGNMKVIISGTCTPVLFDFPAFKP